MAENKIGPNLQAGAGFLAKRVQKSLNRAQEKVSQENITTTCPLDGLSGFRSGVLFFSFISAVQPTFTEPRFHDHSFLFKGRSI